MKFALAVLAVLATASPLTAYKLPATGSGELAKELQSIVDLIPFQPLVAMTRSYMLQDEQFQYMVNLTLSKESKAFVTEMEAAREFKDLMNYMQWQGLDVYMLLNQLNEYLDLPSVSPTSAYGSAITGGVAGYMMDLQRTLPGEQIVKEVTNKRNNSRIVDDLYDTMMSSRYVHFFESLMKNEHFAQLAKQAENANIERNLFETCYSVLLMLLPLV